MDENKKDVNVESGSEIIKDSKMKVNNDEIVITDKDFNKKDNSSKKNIVLEQKLVFKIIAITILVILIITVFVIFYINASENRKCNNINDLVEEASIKYIEDSEIVLDILNPQTSFKLDELFDAGLLNKEDFTNNDILCGGSIKVTMVEGDYVVTQNLTNCDLCTTDIRYGMNWSEYSNELPDENIIDVKYYYNYVEKTVNYSSWTNYLTPAQLEKTPVEEITDERFGIISKDAKNIEIVSEEITYYSYRDYKNKYYSDINNDYSGFSSTQPEGYSEYDENTAIKTEWSEWSVDSPNKESYRSIEEEVGYRFYYLEGEIKHYYNNGQYIPSKPDDKYTEYDKDDHATIYRYRDTMWKWFNGKERDYSYYLVGPTDKYPYVDTDLSYYSDWSDWELTSEVTPSNSTYREEQTQIRIRYQLVFDMYSFNLLEESLEKEKFENEVGMTLEEVNNHDDYALIIEYVYSYREE